MIKLSCMIALLVTSAANAYQLIQIIEPINLSDQSSLPLQSTSKTCSNPVTEAEIPEDCSFYQTCIEDTFGCGPKGYPIGYGYKYCKKLLIKKKSGWGSKKQ